MTPESGAVELLALEYQPPHTVPCLWLWFGSSRIRFLRGCKSCLYLGQGPCAPTCSPDENFSGARNLTAGLPWLT